MEHRIGVYDMKMRVQAQYLQSGDIVGSGETVVAIRGQGLDLPKGKAMIVLEGSKYSRTAYWGKYTMINVERKVEEVSS